VKRKVVACSA